MDCPCYGPLFAILLPNGNSEVLFEKIKKSPLISNRCQNAKRDGIFEKFYKKIEKSPFLTHMNEK